MLEEKLQLFKDSYRSEKTRMDDLETTVLQIY